MSLLLLFGGGGGGGIVVHQAAADWVVDGTFDVAMRRYLRAEADWEVDGELAAVLAIVARARADWVVEGEFTVTIPPIEGRKRVVVVDADGATLGELANAVVQQVRFPLNSWESWGFTIPVEDPQAHLVLEERIREAQVWRGDLLLSWGPMVRPTVTDGLVQVQGVGARWHLSRRHVGKANRDNQLCNPSFEQGLACWNFNRTKYFLDYEALKPYDATIYAPGRDGSWALELNADLHPWVSPTGGSGATVTKMHTVVSGDTLWDLARTYYGSGTEWWRIYEANQAQIQSGAVAAGLWNPRDPGHWIFPGQVFTIPGITVTEVVVAPPDDGTRWGDVFGWQEFAVQGGERGLTATLVGWCKVPSAQLEGWGLGRWGLILQRMPNTWRTSNFWTANGLPNTHGGARAFYTDAIETSSSRLDEGHPLDGWIRHETSITVPPGATEKLIARVNGVNGRTYWDKLTLTYDSAFEAFDTDQATIVAELAEHAQDPAFDKNDVNISTEAPATGVERTLVALHSEHGNVWDLMTQFTGYRDGLDLGMRYTPTERILTTHYPRKGQVRRGLHLQGGRNLASFSWTFDGEAAASSVIILGTGDGSDREESASIDATAFADGLILETVQAVGPDTPVDLLGELAEEALAVAVNPEVLTVTTYPHDPERPERNLIGRLWEGDTVPVTIRRGRILAAGVITGWQFEVDGDYRVVELAILENDSLQLTLNRREPA
jgi:hypothetical protein